MKSLAVILAPVLALAGCAAPAPHAHGPAADGGGKSAGMGAGMMDEMCQRHAAAPDRAASAPESMMDKHCKARADAPAGAASHVH